jgi:hypothetical protein
MLEHILPDAAWATYAYILVVYHLVLAFKVFTSDKKAGLSMPIGQAILTHLACVGLLISIAVLRHQIPLFGLIRLFLPGLAPFEARWLFSGEKAKVERLNDDAAIQAATMHVEPAAVGAVAPAAAAPTPTNGFASVTGLFSHAAPTGASSASAAPSLYDTSTGDDYNEFLTLMQQGKRPFRKPGISIREEYELWLTHRAKTSARAAAKSVQVKA